MKLAGGRVLGQVRTLVLADVSLARLEPLEGTDDIVYIRLPQRVDEPQVDAPGSPLSALGILAKAGARGQEVIAKTGVGAWHAAGFTGAGIKVGIIDGFQLAAWQAANVSGDIAGLPAGTFCAANGSPCDIWAGGTHGVGVAETVSDMAPGATLYIASALTVVYLQAAVNYFKANGVRIITRSQTARYDGAGTGTGGPIADVIANAVNQGIAWFNSAGNTAGTAASPGSYFRQQWFDPDGDNWMDFGTAWY